MVIFAKILQTEPKEKPDYCLGPLHIFCNIFYSFIHGRGLYNLGRNLDGQELGLLNCKTLPFLIEILTINVNCLCACTSSKTNCKSWWGLRRYGRAVKELEPMNVSELGALEFEIQRCFYQQVMILSIKVLYILILR